LPCLLEKLYGLIKVFILLQCTTQIQKLFQRGQPQELSFDDCFNLIAFLTGLVSASATAKGKWYRHLSFYNECHFFITSHCHVKKLTNSPPFNFVPQALVFMLQ